MSSFLLRSSFRARAAAFKPATRSFSLSAARPLKESDRHIEGQAEENEKHKQDQLQKQKEGKGHWKPELASNSEEAVAADRHGHDDHSPEGLKKLQDQTAKHAQEKHE